MRRVLAIEPHRWVNRHGADGCLIKMFGCLLFIFVLLPFFYDFFSCVSLKPSLSTIHCLHYCITVYYILVTFHAARVVNTVVNEGSAHSEFTFFLLDFRAAVYYLYITIVLKYFKIQYCSKKRERAF